MEVKEKIAKLKASMGAMKAIEDAEEKMRKLKLEQQVPLPILVPLAALGVPSLSR